ncbi:MAG: hypothetical protein JXA49_05095 [Actinobacteria bacterium]|nr:hypothetical protein [Actinomycetota bacterium]
MESWQENLLDRIEGIVWAQWVAVGASLTGRPCNLSVVDPEALIVASCSLGRFSPRLFDESLDWTLSNPDLLKKSRLGLIAAEFDGETRKVLAAFAEHVSEAGGGDLLGRIGKSDNGAGDIDRIVSFWLPDKGISRDVEEADEIFLRHGFVRGKPRMRGNSGKPELGNQANMMFRFRQEYGKGARADCMTYLMTGGRGSSNAIASRTKYRQSSTYIALEQLVNAGVVRKYGQSGWNDYWIEGASDKAAKIFSSSSSLPVFFVWSDIFKALFLAAIDFAENGDMDGRSLRGIERARGLMAATVPLLRNAGAPLAAQAVPSLKESAGEQAIVELRRFLESTISVLETHIK